MNHPFWGILHSWKPSYTEKFFSKARSLQLDRSALRHVFLGAQTDGAEDMWAPSSPIFFVGAPDPDLDVIHMKDLLGTPVGDVSIANTPFGLRMDYIYTYIHRVIFIHIYIYIYCAVHIYNTGNVLFLADKAMVFQAIPNFRWHHGPAGSRYRCPAALEPRTGHRRFQISSIEGASHCRWPNCIPYYIPHMIYICIYIYTIYYIWSIYICIHIYIYIYHILYIHISQKVSK